MTTGAADAPYVPRPGFGLPHPHIDAAYAAAPPLVSQRVVWGGHLALDASAHAGRIALDDDLVMSARCVIRVGDDVVVCSTAHGGRHPLPGGRLEPGESVVDAAVREAHEETGWHLDRDTLTPIGWLRFRYVEPCHPDWRHRPHPDLVHVVFTARATARDGSQGGGWSDTEGFEIDSVLLPPDEAVEVVPDPIDRAMLRLAFASPPPPAGS
jgi:8-oxo-dGTP pyrophosphatase MutT (NUDIX family)